jgi:predicted nucleic acid-binding protein
MRKLKIYVETSVWSQALADDAPELRKVTLEFLAAARKEEFELYVSDVVFEEFDRSSEELARKLSELVEELPTISLQYDESSYRLAREYLHNGAVPPSKLDDARHVAVAVVNELDILLSWNYRHLVNIRRREIFHHIGRINGYYKPLQIITPPEVDYER